MARRADNIFDVVVHGSAQELEALIASGGKVTAQDSEKKTPLHHAAELGRADLASVLLDHGAPIDAQDASGATPLWRCGTRPELGVATAALLIERGADVNRPSLYDGAPIHWAARWNHAALIEVLVRGGAAVDARDRRRWTPLHLAAFHGHADAAARLLALGAAPAERTSDGKTAKELAANRAVRGLLPADAASDEKANHAEAVVAKLAELGWFKYVPAADVADVRARFLDAFLVRPSLLAPYEELTLRGIDRRSCAADAENLAEGDIHEVLVLLRDALAHEGVSFSRAVSDVTDQGYDIVLDGARHRLFDGSGYDAHDALERTVAFVNELLEGAGSQARLYGVGRGNEASVLLLCPALAAYVKTLDVSPRIDDLHASEHALARPS